MASTIPNAKELLERTAQKEAEKAAEAIRLQAKADAEKQGLIDRLQKPSGVSDEEALQRVKVIIERAVNNGLTQVQVYRFPNSLCTDRGRADQSAGSRLCQHPHRLAKGDVRFLGTPAEAAWL